MDFLKATIIVALICNFASLASSVPFIVLHGNLQSDFFPFSPFLPF